MSTDKRWSMERGWFNVSHCGLPANCVAVKTLPESSTAGQPYAVGDGYTAMSPVMEEAARVEMPVLVEDGVVSSRSKADRPIGSGSTGPKRRLIQQQDERRTKTWHKDTRQYLYASINNEPER
jgi:hypothetical protein